MCNLNARDLYKKHQMRLVTHHSTHELVLVFLSVSSGALFLFVFLMCALNMFNLPFNLIFKKASHLRPHMQHITRIVHICALGLPLQQERNSIRKRRIIKKKKICCYFQCFKRLILLHASAVSQNMQTVYAVCSHKLMATKRNAPLVNDSKINPKQTLVAYYSYRDGCKVFIV